MIDDRIIAESVSAKGNIQIFEHLEYFNVNPFDLLEAQCQLKITLYSDEDEEEMGSILYRVVKDYQIMEGEFQDYLKFETKKTSLVLRYQIYLKSIEDIRYEDNSLNVLIKEVTEYPEPYEMTVSFQFIKGNNFIVDDNNDPIVYNGEEYYATKLNTVSFQELTLRVPVNYEKLQVLYKNSLNVMYILFKFIVRSGDIHEVYAWYNHPLFTAQKQLNMGEVSAPPPPHSPRHRSLRFCTRTSTSARACLHGAPTPHTERQLPFRATVRLVHGEPVLDACH